MGREQDFLTEVQKNKGWTLNTNFGGVLLRFNGVTVWNEKSRGGIVSSFLTQQDVQSRILRYQQQYQQIITKLRVVFDRFWAARLDVGYLKSDAANIGREDISNDFEYLEKERMLLWDRVSRNLSELMKHAP